MKTKTVLAIVAALSVSVPLSLSSASAAQEVRVPAGTVTTQDQIAASIYSQAVGLGLGEVAALVGIGAGLAETGLVNDTIGNCWVPKCTSGRTSARGVFRFFHSWPPPGTAWSGKKYGPTSGGVGTDFSGFNASNAWGNSGWATKDPRMNPAQAANLFFLGMEGAPQNGLEDGTLFKKLRTTPVSRITARQIALMSQQVMGFPNSALSGYEQAVKPAFAYLQRIKTGAVTAPVYAAPVPGIADQSTTKLTRDALLKEGPGLIAVSWAVSLTNARARKFSEPGTTDPNATNKVYDTSQLVSASYRFATKDSIMVLGVSDQMWLNTKDIVLVPLSQAKPGDILFVKTPAMTRIGHVAFIVDVNGGEKAVWHSGWGHSSNGNKGIGFGPLSSFTTFMTVSRHADKDLLKERKKFLTTTDMSKAYVGRVVSK